MLVRGGVAALVSLLALCMEYTEENPFDPNVNGGRDPFELLAVADSGAVRLSWNELGLTGIQKYLVYRSAADSSDFVFHRELPAERKTVWADSVVSSDTVYYYRVSMVAGGEESHPSDIVSARPLEAPSPRLVVESVGEAVDTVDFSLNHTALNVALTNAGGRVLNVEEMSTTESWIRLTPPTNTVVAPGATRTLQIAVLRDSLDYRDAAYFGFVDIVTDGGNKTLTVRVLHKESSALLSVSPDTIDLDSSGSTARITLGNEGTAVMERCSLFTAQSWIGLETAMVTGLAEGATREVTVTVDRTDGGLEEGLNPGYVTVTSDGGNASVTVLVVKRRSVVPVLALQHDTLDVGEQNETATQVIQNVGTGTLSWELKAPSEKWLLVTGDLSGSLGADSSVAVTIEIVRDKPWRTGRVFAGADGAVARGRQPHFRGDRHESR